MLPRAPTGLLSLAVPASLPVHQCLFIYSRQEILTVTTVLGVGATIAVSITVAVTVSIQEIAWVSVSVAVARDGWGSIALERWVAVTGY